MNIDTAHIVSVIKEKFQAEELNRFFNICPYHYSGSDGKLMLDSDNCILLEFATPAEEFPEFYQSDTYRLLIIFSLREKVNLTPALPVLRRLKDKDNIDRIALWSTVEVEAEVLAMFKDFDIDIISVNIPPSDEVLATRPVTYFIPLDGDLNYCLTVNAVAERLIKRFKKMFHLVLSEVSAAIYNKHYAKSKVATSSAMEFEAKKLNTLIRKLHHHGRCDLAIDVGCGTGRHSFEMAHYFKDVYAYDFSRRMIEQAIDRKRKEDNRNIIFHINDFEHEKVADENDFVGKCDLIVASFGMGSFVEETPEMLRRFYHWLKPDGYIFISFYNANAITLNVTPNWRDVSLSAQVDKDKNSLEVSLTPKTRFNVFCKLFDEGTKGEINKIFNVDEIVTYPTIMALLPNSLLENELARKFFIRADEVVSSDEEEPFAQFGYYVTVIAHKAPSSTNGYDNILSVLRVFQAEYEILEHTPVLSIEDVKQAIGYFPDSMIKTIVLRNQKTEEFIIISVQAEKQIDMERVALSLDTNINKIRFATEKEVLSIGFPLGGIAPFGFEQRVAIVHFLDEDIIHHAGEWLYTRVGDNRKTLKIRKQDFLRITQHYRQIDL